MNKITGERNRFVVSINLLLACSLYSCFIVLKIYFDDDFFGYIGCYYVFVFFVVRVKGDY